MPIDPTGGTLRYTLACIVACIALPASSPAATFVQISGSVGAETYLDKEAFVAAESMSLSDTETSSPTVRALYGDQADFEAYARAAETALHAALVVAKRLESGVATTADFEHLPALVADSDAAWQRAIAGYSVEGEEDDGERRVFVGLHDRVAFRLLMELMRPRAARAKGFGVVSQPDPVVARWVADLFHATVRGETERARMLGRVLRERMGFALEGQRGAVVDDLLDLLRRIDADLGAVGASAGEHLISAMIPGIVALGVEDPCSMADAERAQEAAALTPEQESDLADLGVSFGDLAAQAADDCAIASGLGLDGIAGYSGYGDAMACLGELLGAFEEEATDYGSCMAAGLGASEPGEIGSSTVARANDCSNPVADGDGDDRFEPPTLENWYRNKFIKPKENPTGGYEPPEDEDEKRRKEINASNEDARIVSVSGGLLKEIGKAIANVVTAIVDWVVDLFSSSEPTQESVERQDADTDDADTEDPDADSGDPETPTQDETTLPGPDGFGGSGCQDPWVELAESCLERVVSALPGGDRSETLERDPYGIDPRTAYVWEGSATEGAEALQGCGGAIAPSEPSACEQLTHPPSACGEPAVSEAALFFGEEAQRELFCRTARCDAGAHCECVDGPIGGDDPGAPPAPAPEPEGPVLPGRFLPGPTVSTHETFAAGDTPVGILLPGSGPTAEDDRALMTNGL